jgi:hypothetical protein
MKLYKYSPTDLAMAVEASTSMRQVLLKLGVKPYGGNYDVLRKALKHFQLDTSHFSGQAWNRGLKLDPKHPIARYLANELPMQSYKLKNRLLAENIFKAVCTKCNNTTWQDAPIPLELDHINGDNQDNSLSNLRLLCPNCHALTSTYRGKNRTKA